MHLWTSGGLTEIEQASLATVRLGELLCGRVAECKQAIIVEDLMHSPARNSEVAKAAACCAYAGFPLVACERLIGTVAFAMRTKTHFANGDVEMVKAICDQVAATLHRIQLTTELLSSEERLRFSHRSNGRWDF